jgi:LysR substrate binding domain
MRSYDIFWRSKSRGRAGRGRGGGLPHGLRFEPLFASDRMLIVPRGYELAGKKRPTLRDLARHAFVIPRRDRDGGGRLDVQGLVTREGTGASSATAAVTRLLEEAGRKVVGGLSDLIDGGPEGGGRYGLTRLLGRVEPGCFRLQHFLERLFGRLAEGGAVRQVCPATLGRADLRRDPGRSESCRPRRSRGVERSSAEALA